MALDSEFFYKQEAAYAFLWYLYRNVHESDEFKKFLTQMKPEQISSQQLMAIDNLAMQLERESVRVEGFFKLYIMVLTNFATKGVSIAMSFSPGSLNTPTSVGRHLSAMKSNAATKGNSLSFPTLSQALAELANIKELSRIAVSNKILANQRSTIYGLFGLY